MGRLTARPDVDLDDSRFTADARGMSAFEQHVWMADPNNSRGARAVPLPSRASPPQPYQASARMPAAMPAGEPRPLYSRISSPRSRSKHVRRVRKRNVRKRPPTVQGRLASTIAGWEPEHMIVTLGVRAALLTLLVLPAFLLLTPVSAQAGETEVRISARNADDNEVEFALQQRDHPATGTSASSPAVVSSLMSTTLAGSAAASSGSIASNHPSTSGSSPARRRAGQSSLVCSGLSRARAGANRSFRA